MGHAASVTCVEVLLLPISPSISMSNTRRNWTAGGNGEKSGTIQKSGYAPGRLLSVENALFLQPSYQLFPAALTSVRMAVS